jgi:excisionase family DNA binding protein
MIQSNEHSIGGTDNSHSASSPLLTRHEAARFSRLSIRKLDQAKANGEIAFVAIGRSIRFQVSDVQAWLDRQRVKARRN